jgi:uncharacterized membrane protein HdeD (DUF308 family)
VLSGLAVNWVFLLLRAIVAVLFGVAVLVWPAPSLLAPVMLFAAYAAVDGAAITVAVALRRDLSGAWPLPLAGAVSMLCGVLLVTVGAPDPRWVAGPCALLFALTLVALALRFRQLAEEVAIAS